MKLILASTSPRRFEVLSRAGFKFEVIPSDFEEKILPGVKPTDLVKTLAAGKVMAVAKKHPRSIIVGADTMVLFKNKLCGKPKDKSEARRMLKDFSGQKIKVLSGLAVACLEKSQKIFTDVDVAWVVFKKLSAREIESYIDSGETMDKAGAFGVQGSGLLVLQKIIGNYSTVMGLPLIPMVNIFEKLKLNPKKI